MDQAWPKWNRIRCSPDLLWPQSNWTKTRPNLWVGWCWVKFSMLVMNYEWFRKLFSFFCPDMDCRNIRKELETAPQLLGHQKSFNTEHHLEWHQSFSCLIAWFFHEGIRISIWKSQIMICEMRFPLEYVIFLLIRLRKSNSANISVIMLFCAWQCEIGLAAELI
jgi:hypothetical protein